jgi:hypothetical protein
MDGKMKARVFISTNGRWVSRAIREEDDKWSVDFLLDGQDIRCLATNPLNPTVVFAGRQEGGILLSRDQGLHWQNSGLSGVTIKSLAVGKVEANTVYAGTKSPASIYHSSDGGDTWQEL